MPKTLFLLTVLLLAIPGCESDRGQDALPQTVAAPAPPPVKRLFIEPVDAALVETATAALPVWRQHIAQRPTLLILSNNPFLQTIPGPLQEEAARLVRVAEPLEFERKAVLHSASPVLMPSMAVSAALRNEFFERVIWVLPIPPDSPMPTPEVIRSQLVRNGDISEAEAETLTSDGDTLSGRFRDIPWTICRLEALPSLEGEDIILHIDLSYFSGLYKNEVSTPLYSLLARVGREVRERKWPALDATISMSNLSGHISLKTRFLGKDVASLLEHPDILDAEEMPRLWRLRSRALYLDNLFQPEKSLETYLELEQHYPESPSVKYGLFDMYGQQKEAGKALQRLEEAVALDRIYALEYLDLAERALEHGRVQASMDMLDKAAAAFPEDPFITLKKIALYRQTGGMALASGLITELRKLPWSEVYDPDMPEFLATLAAEAKEAKASSPSKN
jgi:hypothetical protein